MEAATALRQPHVRTVGDRLAVDGLVIADESAVRLVREREEAGDDPVRVGEDLLKQFSSADANNPLADLKERTVEALRTASDQQAQTLRGVEKRMADLQVELQALRDERQKEEELEAERQRGTAKGRTFEEAVYEAIDAIATAQGDDCDAVGDFRGATGKTGDVVVAIDACRGPARGRIVFEAKNAKLSKPKAFEELDRGMREREADFAVLVVPVDDKLPARTAPLREYNGDKLLVAWDLEGSLTLEVAYRLARARVLM